MSWIKRNLFFLVGSVIAVGLLAVAVVYLLGGSAKDGEEKAKLSESYDKLKNLKELEPSPGSAKVDNITNAQAQVAVLKKYVKGAQETFIPIDPIPNTPRVEGQVFSAELHSTLKALRKQAEVSNNVTLPSTNPPYSFTFESIVRQVTFTRQSSLKALARQLGEVKAIAEILFEAKITGLESFKRVRVAEEDDPATNPNDYLAESPKTNDWAVLVPYEVTIHCFSAELAAVFNGFANSKHCLIIQGINVEPLPQADADPFAGPVPGFGPMMPQPYFAAPGAAGGGADAAINARMRSRYGIGGRGAAGPGGRGEGRFNQPPPPPVMAYQPPPVAGGPQPPSDVQVLSEHPVRVTLKITLVHLQGPEGGEAGRRGRGGN